MRGILALFVFSTMCTACSPAQPFLPASTLLASGPSPTSNKGSPFTACPTLSFSGVSWDADLTPYDREVYKVALNITGSFEGHDGWTNITRNFDGMGLSLGLLNQNLGTGTLQPMLLKFMGRHPQAWIRIFSDDTRRASLESMLMSWEQNKQADPGSEANFLDIDFNKDLKSRNSDSVAWAVENIYLSNGQFIQVWKEDFLELAGNPDFSTIQMQSAATYRARAVRDHNRFGLGELRAFLFMFDVSVQNGGFKSVDYNDFNAFVQANPGSTIQDRLQKLLDLRLRHVRPEYIEDVRARKTAVINGSGVVHGSARLLQQEYCYPGFLAYPEVSISLP
ncbi:MAG: hypothetical protein IT289_01645 [Oligoflexia bacterium]|nr:hypothetical protein [Oligoflexia bacterium]